ncbi:MAG: protein-L-isoaspartate O-methyltransferase [Candidatus Pacebacteria bacterium]|jgi:protein-L-isoaspartate(D-aspartate) O-methyltransferase|nr:protein-L-isoaspartate O-methyltransferase [Candidatus Paceibacterota bacterium]
MALIDDLINAGYLRTERIISAFRAIKRADFLTDSLKQRKMIAELDQAIPIGWGQTISQPAVVAFMLELLDPQPGQNILDIGYGSGWTTALLAHIVTQNDTKGRITGIERIRELADFGRRNVGRYGFIDSGIATCVNADGSAGWPAKAPYDRILASASALAIPEPWKHQLKIGGVIVAPVQGAIVRTVKKNKNGFFDEYFEGFAFVPLVESG